MDTKMTVSLKLDRSMYLCPVSWINFIKDLRHRNVEQNTFEGFEIDTLNRELKPFKAQYIPSERVDFANEKCYTLFVLKYGVN
jgi:hypothetical protein